MLNFKPRSTEIEKGGKKRADLAEVRCYLELGEYETAIKRFEVGSEVLRSHIHNYVHLLLTSNPAAFIAIA